MSAPAQQIIERVTLADTWEMVLRSYVFRACFVCGEIGRCKHREPEVELALMEAAAARESRKRRPRK